MANSHLAFAVGSSAENPTGVGDVLAQDFEVVAEVKFVSQVHVDKSITQVRCSGDVPSPQPGAV
jgi:hypothetical protein